MKNTPEIIDIKYDLINELIIVLIYLCLIILFIFKEHFMRYNLSEYHFENEYYLDANCNSYIDV